MAQEIELLEARVDLKQAREVMALWKAGGNRPAYTPRARLAEALRAAIAEVDRLTAERNMQPMPEGRYEININGELKRL